jgi:transcriptional regulator with XRE-family HTH domain
MQTIGDRLSQIRKQLGLSLTSVTGKIKIDKSNLSRIENNKHEPTSGTLAALAKLYGVSADWILFGENATLTGDIKECDNFLKNIDDPEMIFFFMKLRDYWLKGDDAEKGWIKVQLRKAFPHIMEEIRKEQAT